MKRLVLSVALAAALLGGCAPRIYIPPTPEGMACERECMFMNNQCMATYNNVWGCAGQTRRCRSTCPGAYTAP